jgi:hypothetical protein
MAASLLIGPKDYLPHVAHDEYQYANIIEAQTAVLVAAGSGVVHSVTIGVVAAGLLKLYDVASGGTTDATTEIATLSVAALTSGPFILDVAFSKGLTGVLTGATAQVTVYFWGAPLQSSRTFGI